MSTRAAAPSAFAEELAAVIVPSCRNAGLSEGILSGESFSGSSSVSSTLGPAFDWIVIGATSLAKLPSAIAAFARLSDSTA